MKTLLQVAVLIAILIATKQTITDEFWIAVVIEFVFLYADKLIASKKER